MLKKTSKFNILQNFAATLCLAVLLLPMPVFAVKNLTLTLTPPLYQIDMQKNDTWSSLLKVTNLNAFDMVVYADVVNFTLNEHSGRLEPVLDESDELFASSLAGWIQLEKQKAFVPKGGNVQLPFTIATPENASPGEHYAGILIGTQSFDTGNQELVGVERNISNFVSSLVYMSIEGDVVESLDVHSLKTTERYYESPPVDITLVVANDGNVRQQPTGSVVIRDFLRRKRVEFSLSPDDISAIVLPGTSKEYSFTWNPENGLLDSGYYRATATVMWNAGEEEYTDKNSSVFIIIPKKIAIVGIVILSMLFLVMWFVFKIIRMRTRSDAFQEYTEHLRMLREQKKTKKITQKKTKKIIKW